jgi:hypothetical protein
MSDNERMAAATALFARLDADKNNQLDAGESAQLAGVSGASLAQFDKNRDGNISLEEITRALNEQPTYRGALVQARVSQTSDPLFGWLDARPDGRLTSREIDAAQARLGQLDTDGDGTLAAAEIPQRLSCVVVRGAGALQRATPGGMPASPPKPDPDAPRWLAAMDQNGDAEVSGREFLGSPEQFSRLDANGDGFLDAAEARSAK